MAAEANAPSTSGWNQKNPAVRRILADVRELARDPSDQYAAKPVEENMFEWHFVIRGPKGTDFEGGKFHGKILLPAEYPFKPPHIVFLTPNGRWETRTKICLSMSAYHPEDWQPAWGIRTMLEALISFMPSPSDGALGAIDCTPEQRKRLAKESLNYSHPLMPQLPEEGSVTSSSAERSKEIASAVSQMRFHANKKDQDEAGDGEATPEKQKPEGVAVEESQPEATTVEPERPVEVAAPVVVIAASHATSISGDVAPDRVDGVLKIASWCVLLAIFVLTYRKLLVTFAPEL